MEVWEALDGKEKQNRMKHFENAFWRPETIRRRYLHSAGSVRNRGFRYTRWT